MTNHIIHSNARDAIRAAFSRAPSVVGWIAAQDNKPSGWITYDPRAPDPSAVPEILCPATGTLPIPLTDIGKEVWLSVLASLDKPHQHRSW